MRLAARSDVLGALASQLAGASPAAAKTQADLGALETLASLVTQLRAGGLQPEAALAAALEVVEGRQPRPPASRRFAGVYGDSP